ncbi:MAG: alpha/beta hydrolase [Muribaculaceae bacterium]|nr:alpha/beta hydrolase [Muribaculaceae bacterium]
MEKEIEIQGIKVNYNETGNPDGSPVILLHGWGCNFTTVRSIAASLEDGMRVISIDLPGHGKSEEPKNVWGTKDFANLIKLFCRELNITNPSLIGHSFGGRTSIFYASENPVNKLVLVDSAGVTPRRSLKYYYKVYSYKVLKKLSLIFLGEEKGRKLIEKSLKTHGSADYQAASPKMRAIMSKCVNEDLRNIMPQIKAPTLLVWGEEDTATPLSDAKIMENKIPDTGLVSFPNCGHYSFLDNPYQFKAVIRSFFKNELTPSFP